ncbi:MAG TPA: PDZ domain-containing protein [Gemmatimonadales bacterium]|nr:PDZ domain-containing protein [Gemmatimonadales bacterium]
MRMHPPAFIALATLVVPVLLNAQRPAPAAKPRPAPAAAQRSAAIANVRYEVAFDSASAAARTVKVAMRFDVKGTEPVLLSLPAWTPGAYEISNFARWVSNFGADGAGGGGGGALEWDKLDYDTWRVRPTGAGEVTVRFDYLADTLDNAMAWAKPDFLLFNGTNLFLYPEGRGFDFPATVHIEAPADWKVATGMHPTGEPRTYRESNYHDLVDMPFFIGRFDMDSTVVSGRTTRLATYPAGVLTGQPRAMLWEQLGEAIPVESRVFGVTPWDNYTVMQIFDSAYGGGSALEHQSSHVGVYNPMFIGTPILASVSAHEIFHAWNVKRLRPADMVPYEYERPEPTPWLWVSEGITDYYADLALVRGGIIDSTAFFMLTGGKVQNVMDAPPIALEDASLTTWIHPTDGTQYIYYPKGSLAGFLLDIVIRDASDGRRSLDDVMRELYQTTYKHGRGFTGTDWWNTVSRDAGGKAFGDFYAKYIDGRQPFPYAQVLPLAGLRLVADTTRAPRLGVGTGPDSAGQGSRVVQVVPGGAAEQAGVQVGDVLLALGDFQITDPDFGPGFRQRYANAEGQDLPIKLRRGTDTLTVNAKVRLTEQVDVRIESDPNASAKAVRVRDGLLKGGS